MWERTKIKKGKKIKVSEHTWSDWHPQMHFILSISLYGWVTDCRLRTTWSSDNCIHWHSVSQQKGVKWKGIRESRSKLRFHLTSAHWLPNFLSHFPSHFRHLPFPYDLLILILFQRDCKRLSLLFPLNANPTHKKTCQDEWELVCHFQFCWDISVKNNWCVSNHRG